MQMDSKKEVNYSGLSETFQIDNDFENGLDDLLGSLDATPTNDPQKSDIVVDAEEVEEDNDTDEITPIPSIEPSEPQPVMETSCGLVTSPSQSIANTQHLEIQVKQYPERIDNTDYLDTRIKNIIRSCESMIETAQYQVSSAGTPESIEAAAKLVVAASTLMTEMNKAVMLDRTQRKKIELETIKAQHRLIEMEKKYKLIMEKDAKKLTMGQGNQFNQNNTYIVHSQEDIVDYIQQQFNKEPIKTN